MPYVLSRRARRDIDRIAAVVARERRRPAADRMIERLRTAFDMLGAHPSAGRDRRDDLGPGRRSSVSGLSIIVYKPFGRDVLIERVIDGRRDYPSLFRP